MRHLSKPIFTFAATAFLLTATASGSHATLIDWTSFSNPSGTTSVSGQLGSSGISATVAGSGGSARIYAPNTFINNNYNWSGSAYTPNAFGTDALYFENLSAGSFDTWTVNFSSAVVDPILYFYGLERTYSFDNPIALVSASTSGFTLTSNSITGNSFTPNYAAGLIQLTGTYTSLNIYGTGVTGNGHNRDAVYIQIGATPYVEPDPEDPDPEPVTPVSEPSPFLPLGMAIVLIAISRRHRARQFRH